MTLLTAGETPIGASAAGSELANFDPEELVDA
jgi:hypothetical protein